LHFQGNLSLQEQLIICLELSINFLYFSRFYFVSSADLLDILSNGNEPEKVMKHLTKLFDSMAKLKADKSKEKVALGMQAKDGENVEFPNPCDLSGAVEIWLNRLLDMQCNTILHWLTEAVQAYEEKSREQWVLEFPGQIALTGSQIWWTTEVNMAFAKLEEGFENALKDYYKKQVSQLNNLITLLLGDLTSGDRQKIMTICTIDVHARDVVTKMIAAKIENSGEFLWQCQLRHRWDDEKKDCFANICDAQFKYAHEYLGNQPRLVITPLTDR
jgi:dynein heavy chain